MYINPLSANLKSDETTSSGTDLGSGAFLTLLIAQLRSQSPFDPMDPVQFVNQLVQFNMLDQTIRIRQDLDTQSAAKSATNTTS